MDLPNLDRPEVYASFDPSGLRDRLRALPQQCRAAWRQSQAPLPADLTGDYDKVVIGGMGGSAIAGDLVADLAALQRTVPVVVVRSFHLPFTLDRRSLFISCSYSGNTRETLSLFRQAIADGAQVLAVTAGGTLAQEAQERNIPVLPVDAPGEPRSAVGYNLILLLGALNRSGLVSVSDDEAQAAVAGLELQLSRIGEEVPTPDNPAKLLARELLDKLVVVYGGGIFSGVARRWKAQLNENAKAWAFYENIPESLHNSGGTLRRGLCGGPGRYGPGAPTRDGGNGGNGQRRTKGTLPGLDRDALAGARSATGYCRGRTARPWPNC